MSVYAEDNALEELNGERRDRVVSTEWHGSETTESTWHFVGLQSWIQRNATKKTVESTRGTDGGPELSEQECISAESAEW